MTPRRLSATRADILRLLLAGMCTKEIASEVHLAPRGVKWHLSELYREHEVSGRSALAAKFRDRDLPERPRVSIDQALERLGNITREMTRRIVALHREIEVMRETMAATAAAIRAATPPADVTVRADSLAAARHHEATAHLLREQAQAEQARDYLYRRPR